MIVNGFGAVCTFIVMIVFAVTKFNDGAWIIVLIIPSIVAIFFTIHRHYKSLASKLSLENFSSTPNIRRHRIVVLVAGVHRGSLTALAYAQSLGKDVTAVHVSVDPVELESSRPVGHIWWGNAAGHSRIAIPFVYRASNGVYRRTSGYSAAL